MTILKIPEIFWTKIFCGPKLKFRIRRASSTLNPIPKKSDPWEMTRKQGEEAKIDDSMQIATQ